MRRGIAVYASASLVEPAQSRVEGVSLLDYLWTFTATSTHTASLLVSSLGVTGCVLSIECIQFA